jgi:hypothetical protein
MVDVLYRPDWEQAKERIEAWWEKKMVDRVAIQVTAPSSVCAKLFIEQPKTIEGQWTDIEWILERAEGRIKTTYYGGEAFPLYFPNLGPDIFAGYLGCDIQFSRETSWSVPLIEDWETAEPLKFDKANKWWQLTLQLTEEAAKRGQGKYFVGITDLHGGGDAVAALRDPQNLAMDLLDHPDHVKEAMKVVEKMWFEVYQTLYDIIQKHMKGSSTWLSTWSSGKYYPVSCDFICMISPQMFEEFFVSELEAEIKWLDRSLFHLDGPGAIKHLDRLLEISELDGIQWVPTYGVGSMLDWIPLLKRIQMAGKCIHIAVKANEIEPILKELSPKGLMFSTHANSIDEANELLRRAGKWSLTRST